MEDSVIYVNRPILTAVGASLADWGRVELGWREAVSRGEKGSSGPGGD